ncbi:radical SAM-modified peptide, FtsH ternary system-associated [Streptomyces sp. NPDC102476]|uniref:radical SAM-modified peptide, FtsH ternary system-associated n=1 Tax=Streptomyces sp. NPDC102476 TaxID=3366181 RepID=UPI003815EA4F
MSAAEPPVPPEGSTPPVRYRIVPDLPDLIEAEEYAEHPQGRLVRMRVSWSADGVEILADAFRPDELEALLEALGPEEIEQMMCG